MQSAAAGCSPDIMCGFEQDDVIAAVFPFRMTFVHKLARFGSINRTHRRGASGDENERSDPFQRGVRLLTGAPTGDREQRQQRTIRQLPYTNASKV